MSLALASLVGPHFLERGDVLREIAGIHPAAARRPLRDGHVQGQGDSRVRARFQCGEGALRVRIRGERLLQVLKVLLVHQRAGMTGAVSRFAEDLDVFLGLGERSRGDVRGENLHLVVGRDSFQVCKDREGDQGENVTHGILSGRERYIRWRTGEKVKKWPEAAGFHPRATVSFCVVP